MKLVRTIKTRIYPNKEQASQIMLTVHACRFVYNHMLERKTKAYQRRRESLSYMDMQNLLPAMKEVFPWLSDADSQALQHACRNLSDAFKNFFEKRSGFPKFKSKKKSRLSYVTTQRSVLSYESRRVKLPKLGWIEHRDSRILPTGAIIKEAALEVTRRGAFYVSITYEYEKDVPKNTS